jgi:hypothetical protein
MKSQLALILLLQLSAVLVYGQNPDCQWRDPDTKFEFDLNPLMQDGSDYTFNVQADQVITYYVNVCGPIVKSTSLCTAAKTGACQVWTGSSASIGLSTSLQLGPLKTPQKSTDKGLTGTMTGGTDGRASEIDFICNPDIAIGEPEFQEQQGNTYLMRWETKLACDTSGAPSSGGDDSDSDSGGGLSGGSIFLIILLVSVVVYFVGGVVVNKFVRKTEGVTDTLPNAAFWGSIPGLVRDGFKFVIGKVRGGGNGSYQQTA